MYVKERRAHLQPNTKVQFVSSLDSTVMFNFEKKTYEMQLSMSHKVSFSKVCTALKRSEKNHVDLFAEMLKTKAIIASSNFHVFIISCDEVHLRSSPTS